MENNTYRTPVRGRGRTTVAMALVLAAALLGTLLAQAPRASAAVSGLVAAYSFDEGTGTTARDTSGSNNNGTVSGATWTTGRFGKALAFSSSSARVTVPDSASLDLTSGHTVEAWVKPASTTGNQVVVMKENPGSMAYALYGVTAPNGGAGRVRSAALVNYSAGTTNRMTVGTWYHIATTYDGTTLRYYENGVLKGSTAAPGPLKLTDGALEVGNNVWGEAFKGTIDEVRVYRRALSASELAADAATSVAVQTAPTTTTTTTTTAKPTTTTTTTTTTIPKPVSKFPGDVAPGYVRWGAAVDGNGDPYARHEQYTGVPMGVRRTYFGWSSRATSMVTTAKGDVAAGRLPWVSVKPPVDAAGVSDWKGMGAGTYDAQIDEMLKGLATAGGPVWLTVHHEPEGGNGTAYPDAGQGTEGDWRAMQTRVRQRITATGVTNVAFAPVLMSWTFDSRSGRNPADWWVPGIWDFAGIDHYVDNEAAPGPGTSTDTMWAATMSFYSGKGLKVALGEWGDRGTDATAAAEMQAFYDLARTSGTSGKPQVIGMAYFDSGLNSSTGSWSLVGEPLTRFRDLMKAPTSLRVTQSGF